MGEKKEEGLDLPLMKAMQLAGNENAEPEEAPVEKAEKAEKSEEKPEEKSEEAPEKVEGTEDNTESVQEPTDLGEAKDSKSEPVKAEEKKPDVVPEAVQRRIDELTAKIYEERRAREAVEAKLAAQPKEEKAPRTVEECTDAQLQTIIKDYPEFADEARVELATRRSIARMETKLQQEREKERAIQRQNLLSQEWADLTQKHPALNDKNSELYTLANKHYANFDQARPGSMRAAVALAKEDLEEKTSSALQREKSRMEKARQKSAVSAASTTTKSGLRSSAPDMKKLEERAAAAGGDMNHPDWLAFMKATAPKKSKEE